MWSNTLVSSRGARTGSYDDLLYDTLVLVQNKAYHAVHNPQGVVNLGTAVNCLMDEEICERMGRGDALAFRSEHQHYFTMDGTTSVKKAIACFLNQRLHPLNTISPSHVSVLAGSTTCLDTLAYALCDEGDVMLTPSPVYGRIITDFRDLANVCVQTLDLLPQEDGDGTTFSLKAEEVEGRIEQLRAQGRRVRAFVLLNPQNPLGDVYPPALLTQLLDVCARHEIHFICDEVYAFSVHDEEAQFSSVLTLPLPDPSRTHVIWALSKDFGLAGLRVGAIISQNKGLLACIKNCAIFKPTPYILQHAATVLLEDEAWCDVLLTTYKKRLAEAYRSARERLEAMGVTVREGRAGIFIWFNVSAFMPRLTPEEDLAMHKELLEAGVYTVPGCAMYCSSPGWMRVVVSVPPAHLQQGLNRLENFLLMKKKKMIA